jgi:hypothetical protein
MYSEVEIRNEKEILLGKPLKKFLPERIRRDWSFVENVRWLELADYFVQSWFIMRVSERPVDIMVTFSMLRLVLL